MTLEKTVSERLKNLRLEKNFLQEDFAKALNISVSAYRLVEQGKRDINTKILEALKNKFDVSADWLLFGKNTDHYTADRLHDIFANAAESYQLLEHFYTAFDTITTDLISKNKENEQKINSVIEKYFIDEFEYWKVEREMIEKYRTEILSIILKKKDITKLKDKILSHSDMVTSVNIQFYMLLSTYIKKSANTIIQDVFKTEFEKLKTT